MGCPTASANAQRYPTYPCKTRILGHILIFVKFCRFVGTEYAVFQFRVQRYDFFPIYANNLLFFYVIVGTIVVVGVDMDSNSGFLLFFELLLKVLNALLVLGE